LIVVEGDVQMTHCSATDNQSFPHTAHSLVANKSFSEIVVNQIKIKDFDFY
jgi:hypothetical protein